MNSISEIMCLCRLCLEKEDVNTPIFEEQGEIGQISLKISTCLPVKVSKEDDLPKNICGGCLCKLEMFYQFWNTCANADKKLVKWIDQISVNKISDKRESAASNVLIQHSIDSNPIVLKQEVMEIVDTQSDDLVSEHLNMSNDDQDYLLQQQSLTYEPVEFQFQQDEFETVAEDDSSNAGVQSHSQHKRVAAMRSLSHVESEDEDDPDSMNAHITKTEDDTDDSGEGDPKPTTFVGLPPDDNVQAGTSTAVQSIRDAPSRHSQHKKNADLYSKYKTKFGLKPCAVYLDNLALTKDTLSKLNLKQLTIIPLKILPLSKESLNVFGKLYQKPTFSCTQCLEKFDDNIKLKRHSMVHKMKPNKLAKKQSYKCYICLKKFSDRNILWGHMRNHSGKSGELKCPHCQKTFKEQKIFSAHKTVCSKSSEVVEKSTWIMNAPVLKYRCCICMKRFADVLAMREHKKHHSNSKESDLENEETVSVNEEWQFKCCQQIFPNLNFLCLHMYQSFLEDENLSCSPQYVCSVCGTTFSGGLEWKQHNKKIHDLNFDYGLETKIKYVCSACGMKYDDVVKLLFHRLLVCKTSSLIELYESVSFAKVTTEKTNNCVMPVVTESAPNQINISVNLQPTNPQQSLVTIILNSTEHLKPYENTPASASSNLRICTSPKDIKVESVQTKEKAIDVSESEDEISDMSKPRIFVRNLEELMAPSETKTSEPMLCKDCGKCFRNLYTYRMHTNISLKKNTCKLCSYQTCVFPNLRKHYAEVHHASYLCFRCKKFFTTVEDCREHKCDVEGFGSVPYFSGSLFQDRND